MEDDEKKRAAATGIQDLEKKYTLGQMAKGDVLFAATGVTDGTMLRGVKRAGSSASTHSIVMRSSTGTVRKIETTHDWTKKTEYKDTKV